MAKEKGTESKSTFLNRRIFWTHEVVQRPDGYYYEWTNWATHRVELVFAGYSRSVLIQRSSAWKIVQEKLKS